MTKLPGAAGSVSAMLLAALALAGCAGDGSGEDAPPAPPSVAAPAHAVVGSYVAHVRPREGRIDLARVRRDLAGSELTPQGLTNASIVSNSVAFSGPDDTVELDTTGTKDTFGTGASGSCPASAFCGDVTFTHFFPGLNLSAVYAQVTGITTAGGTILHNHNAKNGVASTPFGVDLTYGAWSYTASMATLGYGGGASQTWAFANPDDSDFYVYLDVWAALYPMLWFDTAANGGITQTAPLVAGQPAIVHYMYARNGACRGAGWSMQGYVKGVNIDIHTTSWPGVATDTFFDQQMVMPFAGGVGLWFNNTDSSSCNTYDSNGNNNYNFGTTAPTPAIHFSGPNSAVNPYYTNDWQNYADGGVKAGSTITVDYEVDRATCIKVDRYGRVPAASNLSMWYAYDSKGGVYTKVNLLGTPYGVPASINGLAGKVFVPPSIPLAGGHSQLWVYFEYDDGGSCHNYDSNNSANYTFPI